MSRKHSSNYFRTYFASPMKTGSEASDGTGGNRDMTMNHVYAGTSADGTARSDAGSLRILTLEEDGDDNTGSFGLGARKA